MGKSEYHHVVDGEWIEPPMKGGKDQCCDCGLVHTINYRLRGSKIQVQVYRDNRATNGARRGKAIKVKT